MEGAKYRNKTIVKNFMVKRTMLDITAINQDGSINTRREDHLQSATRPGMKIKDIAREVGWSR